MPWPASRTMPGRPLSSGSNTGSGSGRSGPGSTEPRRRPASCSPGRWMKSGRPPRPVDPDADNARTHGPDPERQDARPAPLGAGEGRAAPPARRAGPARPPPRPPRPVRPGPGRRRRDRPVPGPPPARGRAVRGRAGGRRHGPRAAGGGEGPQPAVLTDPDLGRRFVRETRAAARLDHRASSGSSTRARTAACRSW